MPSTKDSKKKASADLGDKTTSGHNSQHTMSTRSTETSDTMKTYDDDESLSLRQEIDEVQMNLSRLNTMVQQLEAGMEADQPAKKTKKKKKKQAKVEKKNRTNEDATPSTSEWLHVQTADIHQPLHQPSAHSQSSQPSTTSHSRRRSLRPSSCHSLKSTGRSRNARNSLRRGSLHSSRSMHGVMDDAASVVSQKSTGLQSVSYSIKSLPREIELDDEDDYSFFDDSSRRQDEDSRSVESRSAYSQTSRRSQASRRSRRSIRRNSLKPNEDDEKNSSDGSSNNKTSANASTDTIQVENKQLLDPYGDYGVYTGALSKSTGMPNGKGILKYEKAERWCEGDWIHGRLTGYGKLSSGTGDFYEGRLKNNELHGFGVMQFEDGRVFEGRYNKGEMVRGKMKYQDGSLYDGSWVNGTRHGYGKCVFGDGSVYEGEFWEGHFHGQGQMTWVDGGFYIGDWHIGEMHGQGKEIRPNGRLRHHGEWSHGQPVRRRS